MRIDEYDNLLKQVEEKHKKAVAAAEKERAERLKAIETVWNMLKGEVSSNDGKKDVEYGSLTENVKKSLNFVPEVFSKNDILRVINCEVNDNSLAGCLARLEKQQLIEKVEQGKGRSPSKYRKISENSKKPWISDVLISDNNSDKDIPFD